MLNATPVVRIFGSAVALSFLVSGSAPAFAQREGARLPPYSVKTPGARPPAPVQQKTPTTVIEFELLDSGEGGALHAHNWRKIFDDLDVSLKVRRPVLDDEPTVKEVERGSMRRVTVIGRIDRRGQLEFADRSIGHDDLSKLREWVEQLRVYGAQGSPDGKLLWGLSETQAKTLFSAFVLKSPKELQGVLLVEAIESLEFPKTYPLTWSQAALEQLRATPAAKGKVVRQSTAAFAKGTALAVALREQGFGFRPNRTPSGQIELLVEPAGSRDDHWPIGRPLAGNRQQSAPALFEMQPLEVNEVPLADVLQEVSERTKVPVVLDDHGMRQRGIDLRKATVNIRPRKTSWSIALRSAVHQAGLTQELLQDDAGLPFLWVSPIVIPAKAER